MNSAHKLSNRELGQRARRDREAEEREPSPQLPAHGEVVGRIVYELHGQRVEAELLATGRHCRSYGVQIDGKVIGMMGADEVWRDHVRPKVRPMMSLRHCIRG